MIEILCGGICGCGRFYEATEEELAFRQNILDAIEITECKQREAALALEVHGLRRGLQVIETTLVERGFECNQNEGPIANLQAVLGLLMCAVALQEKHLENSRSEIRALRDEVEMYRNGGHVAVKHVAVKEGSK